MATRQAAAVYLADSRRKGARFRRAMDVIARLRANEAPDLTPTELDCMENDYYRFLHRPRD